DKDATSSPTPPSEAEAAAKPNTKYGSQYVYNQSKAESRFQRQHEVYNLNYRVAVPKSYSLTGNLGSWYDGVRDNPKCISTLNMNDPFYKHRDINLILDIKAENMFGTEVNYVT